MSLTFYFAPMSTASTVHWTLEELGIPYEGVKVDLKDDADKKKKLGPVNPNMKVPVLVHDGVVIFESAAIQIYLGETFGVDKGLFPAPGPKRGEALKWLVWTNVTLGDAMGRWQRNTSEFFPKDQQNAAAGAAGRKELDNVLGILEQHLGSRKYLLGDAISVPDFHLSSFMQWVTMCGVKLDAFPKTAAWMKTCIERPAYAKLMQG
jgi:glutathione S-transferase